MEREYYATSVHKGHTKHSYLDDYDFDWIVKESTDYLKSRGFSKEDFVDDHSNVTDEIEEIITKVVCEKACDNFGWKYGFGMFIIPSIAEDIYEVIKPNFMEE